MSVELVAADGRRIIFSQSDGATGIARVRFLVGENTAMVIKASCVVPGTTTSLDVSLVSIGSSPARLLTGEPSNPLLPAPNTTEQGNSSDPKPITYGITEDGCSGQSCDAVVPVMEEPFRKRPEEEDKREKGMHGWLMVVATLILSAAYQAGLNPPGGVWKEDSDGHRAGMAIRKDNDPFNFTVYKICNSLALCQSVGVILLLIKRRVRPGTFLVDAPRLLVCSSVLMLVIAYIYGAESLMTEYHFPVMYLFALPFIAAQALQRLWPVVSARLPQPSRRPSWVGALLNHSGICRSFAMLLQAFLMLLAVPVVAVFMKTCRGSSLVKWVADGCVFFLVAVSFWALAA